MKKLITGSIVLFAFSFNAHSSSNTYYELKTLDLFMNKEIKERNLANVVADASEKSFNPLGYKRGAKPALFGYVDLKKDQDGYFVEDVYCRKVIRTSVGPNRIPNNNTMNTEHTWPQSKGSKREPFRGDLHHLFPTDSRANSKRGNHIFGEVDRGESPYHGCSASKYGSVKGVDGERTGVRGYQPPEEHRGNVARALFYSSVFYGKKITPLEEFYLKKWHKEDPVDAEEKRRNDLIEEVQGNRNPFIDYPELVERISDF